MIKEISIEKLAVQIYETRQKMGSAAAVMAIAAIKKVLSQKNEANIVFAAAASQNEFLDALAATDDVDWNRVNAFHMDEYMGLPKDHPQRFGNFLYHRIFKKIPLKHVYYLNKDADDTEDEATRYAGLLDQMPPDVTLMGIGENTHLAFNDPHVADFNDPQLVKIIDLDEACKVQQVGDGCFASVAEVPSYAYTLTIPALLHAKYIFCIVPGKNKAQAVKHTLRDHISETYPSTILRTHDHAILFLDQHSAALI